MPKKKIVLRKPARKGPSSLDAVITARQEFAASLEEPPFLAAVESAERHALDRMHFWGGVSLMALSSVMFVHGVDPTVFLGTALGGGLAMLLE